MCDEAVQGRKEAIKTAHDSTKQILTLSTAVITAIIGVVLVVDVKSSAAAGIAAGAAFSFFVSNVFGLLALFGLAGALEEGLYTSQDRPLMKSHYRNFGLLQFGFFGLASLVMFIAIFVALSDGAPTRS